MKENFNFERKIISALDSNFQLDREMWQEKNKDEIKFMIDGQLIYLDRLIDDCRSDGDSIANNMAVEHLQKERNEWLSHFKQGLVGAIFTKNPSEDQIWAREKYLNIVHHSDKIKNKFETVVNKKYDPDKFIDYCGEFFANNPQELDDSFLIEIIYERQKFYKEQENNLRNQKEQLENNFLKKFEEFKIKNNLETNELEIARILKSTQLYPVDPLCAALEGVGGRYFNKFHRIEIDLTTDKFDHVYNHEALHAISGRTILYEKGDDYPRYSSLRDGLYFTNKNKEIYSKEKESFRWLNEAITEKMAMELSGEQTACYANEINVLDILIEKSNGSLKNSDFYSAYFEQYDSSSSEKLPSWKSLFKKIQTIYDKTFLQKLDRIIFTHGTINVLNFLKKYDWKTLDDKNILNFIERNEI